MDIRGLHNFLRQPTYNDDDLITQPELDAASGLLQTDIDANTANIGSNDTEITELQTASGDLNIRLTAAEASITTNTSNINSNDTDITALQSASGHTLQEAYDGGRTIALSDSYGIEITQENYAARDALYILSHNSHQVDGGALYIRQTLGGNNAAARFDAADRALTVHSSGASDTIVGAFFDSDSDSSNTANVHIQRSNAAGVGPALRCVHYADQGIDIVGSNDNWSIRRDGTAFVGMLESVSGIRGDVGSEDHSAGAIFAESGNFSRALKVKTGSDAPEGYIFQVHNSTYGTDGVEIKSTNALVALKIDYNYGSHPSSGIINIVSNATGGDIIRVNNNAHLTAGGAWTDGSSVRNKTLRTEWGPNDAQLMLHLMNMPVYTYEYKQEPNVRHIGPTSEDFNRLFGLGDDESIAPKDLAGLALACIKHLCHRVQILEEQVRHLEGR
jgi:hypothetical protein